MRDFVCKLEFCQNIHKLSALYSESKAKQIRKQNAVKHVTFDSVYAQC